VTLAVLCAHLGCSSGTRRLNVVLVVIDTLRQDHLGHEGWTRDTSPAIDALARDATRFTNAYAPAPWTKPSIASMLTGLYPGSHGVQQMASTLPDDVRTLAEILGEHGYATVGVISHMLITARSSNFQQGFDIYSEIVDEDSHRAVSTEAVTDYGLKALEGLARGSKPFFLLLHYFDPHYDYLRHPEYGFAPESAGALDGSETYGELWERMEGPGLTEEEVDLVEAIYDEEIRHTDSGIARLLEGIAELGLLDETWIIVTADHGEEFLDHGLLGHNHSLYEEVMRAPLIVRRPGEPLPATVAHPVSLVALAPTILDLLDVPVGEVVFQAESVAPLMSDAGSAGSDTVFLEVDFGFDAEAIRKKAVVSGALKLIRDDPTGELELYDLSRDPHERNDLVGLRSELVDRLVPVLDAEIARSQAIALDPEETTFSEEELERLRSLGYVQ
jgi:arylsulfatase A-like enzyme